MDEDIDFKSAVAGVTPVGKRDRIRPLQKKLSYRPLQQEADDRQVMQELMSESDWLAAEGVETGEELSYQGPGIQDRSFRRLRRGVYRVAAELDLHGMRAAEAKAQVKAFLDEAIHQNHRCVRVIHGKGLGSDQRGPVLKQHVDVWLRRREDVLAFCSCIPRHGGSGAAYVLLRCELR